jgi:hypothetical protein
MYAAHNNDSSLILAMNSSSCFSLEKATITEPIRNKIPKMVAVRLTSSNPKITGGLLKKLTPFE